MGFGGNYVLASAPFLWFYCPNCVARLACCAAHCTLEMVIGQYSYCKNYRLHLLPFEFEFCWLSHDPHHESLV